MDVLTEEEVRNWMLEKAININNEEYFIGYNVIHSERIPNDSGKKNYISKQLSKLDFGKKYLLYINEYNIWPSSENMDLFIGYRKFIGINGMLSESPGHLLQFSEKSELYCMLCMILYFYWGALLISEDVGKIIRISHDEYIEIMIKNSLTDNAFLSDFKAIFE